MRNYHNFSLPQKFGEKLTNHAKNSVAQAFLLGKKFNHRKIKNIHLFYSIYLEKNSMGSVILRDLGLKKEFFKNYFKKTTSNPNLKSSSKKLSSLELTSALKKTLARAYVIAKNLNYGYVGTEHLIYALLESKDKDIQNLLFKKIELKKTSKKTPGLTNLDELLKKSRQLQSDFSSQPSFSQDFMKTFMDFPSSSASVSSPSSFPEDLSDFFLKQDTVSKNKSATPFIDKFCVNINKKAIQQKEIIIGRKNELERTINILGRRNKNNPLLIGHPGVGKTALVFGLAQLINTDQVPPFLLEKTIMSLDIAALVAGTSFRGEFESRLKGIVKEISQNKNLILFIDEIHNIVGTGNVTGSLDLANIIKPALAQGDIRLIGTTTFSEYKKYIEKDSALERRFQPIQIKEPNINETKKILMGIKNHYETFHQVSINPQIVELAVELSQRYVKNRYLPDKAIDVIDEASSQIRSQNKLSDLEIKIKGLKKKQQKLLSEKERLINKEKYEKAIQIRQLEKETTEKIKFLENHQLSTEKEKQIEIQPRDIFKTVAHISGITEEKLSQEKNGKIKNISQILTKQIIGQKEAVEKITNALLRAQSGIENVDQPLGSFLFMGPTGVGKTLTAKVLAQEFFSDAGPLIRIDMSEFMERHNVASLIGSPAGYVGYGEGGRLTEKVRRNPYSVVLFDEIEKAHPDIFNLLLQILEDGVLTDAEGLEVNFKNTIIILTTNIGTHDFMNATQIGFENKLSRDVFKKFDAIKEKSLKELGKKIKPELLNRLDYILVFNPLGKNELKKITVLEINKLKQKLKKQHITLTISRAVINFITQKSLAINQGARLIRKNLRELLENPIAKMIVYNEVKDEKIKADIKNGIIELK